MDFFYTSGLFLKLRKIGRYLRVNKFIRSVVDMNDYQSDFDHMMINSLKKGDVFWDVGSNQGEIIKKGKSFLGNDIYCVAFEPHPTLSANLKKLDFKKFKVINAALSNQVGEAEFIYGSDIQQTTGRLNLKLSSSNQNQVKVIDVQYALKVLNLKRPNIIKVDVEGHEYEVLDSILSNIGELRNLRAIFVEIHMAILDNRNLTFEMKKLMEKYQTKTNLKLDWVDLSHFKLER